MNDEPNDFLSKYLTPRGSRGNRFGEELDQDTPDSPAGYSSPMLDLELANGDRVAFPYATLMKIEFDPSRCITLRFASDDVVITGHSLEPLYKAIAQHRVPTVRVTGDRRGFVETASGEPVVTQIRCGPATDDQAA